MTNLAESVPGLSKYMSEGPELVVVKGFDHEAAYEEVLAGMQYLSVRHPEGCLQWLREERPEVWAHLKKLDQTVDAAYEMENIGAVRVAVREMKDGYVEAYNIYLGRNLNEQEGLFG